MRLRFHPEARDEFRASAAYYEEQREHLGKAFTLEIEAVLDKISTSPNSWPILEEDVRRCLAHRFPYGVLYSVESNYILIIAVMHFSRKPGYWRDRHAS